MVFLKYHWVANECLLCFETIGDSFSPHLSRVNIDFLVIVHPARIDFPNVISMDGSKMVPIS